jgi:Topoisomerase DNA binding C4 zinc finger
MLGRTPNERSCFGSAPSQPDSENVPQHELRWWWPPPRARWIPRKHSMAKMNWKKVKAENKARTHGFERLSKPRKSNLPEPTNAVVDQHCEFCQSRAVHRVSRFGPFLGCERYPQCTATRSLSSDGARILGVWKLSKLQLSRAD